MEEEEPDFGDYREEEKGRKESSHLKYHFYVKGLNLGSQSTERLEEELISELESKFGPVQSDFVRVKELTNNKAEALIGFKYDKDAEKLLNRKQDFREHEKLEPTEVFRALLDKRQRQKPTTKREGRRSRSPWGSSPVLLILCPPSQVRDSDILQELSHLQCSETPKIEYVFSNLVEIGRGLIIKLSFRHMHTVEYLTKKEMELKGKPVLLLEPSLKHDLERSVKHAIPHHQVCVECEDLSADEVEKAMQQFGRIAQLDSKGDMFLVTYTQLRSARSAAQTGSITYTDVTIQISKNRPK